MLDHNKITRPGSTDLIFNRIVREKITELFSKKGIDYTGQVEIKEITDKPILGSGVMERSFPREFQLFGWKRPKLASG